MWIIAKNEMVKVKSKQILMGFSAGTVIQALADQDPEVILDWSNGQDVLAKGEMPHGVTGLETKA